MIPINQLKNNNTMENNIATQDVLREAKINITFYQNKIIQILRDIKNYSTFFDQDGDKMWETLSERSKATLSEFENCLNIEQETYKRILQENTDRTN